MADGRHFENGFTAVSKTGRRVQGTVEAVYFPSLSPPLPVLFCVFLFPLPIPPFRCPLTQRLGKRCKLSQRVRTEPGRRQLVSVHFKVKSRYFPPQKNVSYLMQKVAGLQDINECLNWGCSTPGVSSRNLKKKQ